MALYKEAYPNLNHIQLREKLQNNVIDLGTDGRDSFFGLGLVNAASLSKVQEEPKVAQEGTNSEEAVLSETTEPTPVQEAVTQPVQGPVAQPVHNL